MAQLPVIPSVGDCWACKNYEHEANEITSALARVADPTLPPPEDEGPGTGLKKLFSWFVPMPSNCQCINRAVIMDTWGGQRCLDNLSTILGWLRESALDAGYPFSELVVASLLRSFLRLYIKSVDGYKRP